MRIRLDRTGTRGLNQIQSALFFSLSLYVDGGQVMRQEIVCDPSWLCVPLSTEINLHFSPLVKKNIGRTSSYLRPYDLNPYVYNYSIKRAKLMRTAAPYDLAIHFVLNSFLEPIPHT